MKKIKMLKTMNGSQNGILVETFFKGKEYLISKKLADIFVRQLNAAKYEAEEKAIDCAPKNKMAVTPNNKRANDGDRIRR